MTILWRASMEIGDAGIDADHKNLVHLINAVELALLASGSSASASLAGNLDQLTSYTKEHFKREENLMSQTGYSGLERQREAHRELRARLGKIRVAIEAAKANAVPPAENDRLVDLLRHWLLDHVLKEDMLLKPFLKGLE